MLHRLDCEFVRILRRLQSSVKRNLITRGNNAIVKNAIITKTRLFKDKLKISSPKTESFQMKKI